MTGIELREYRLALGLSQAQLAERIGLTRVMVSMMERDRKAITLRTIAAVKAALPAPANQPIANHSVLHRKLELALQNAGISYTANKKYGDHAADFYLKDLDIALYVDAVRSEARRKITTEVDTISVAGRFALDAFTTLIERGGVQAYLNAGREPYASES